MFCFFVLSTITRPSSVIFYCGQKVFQSVVTAIQLVVPIANADNALCSQRGWLLQSLPPLRGYFMMYSDFYRPILHEYLGAFSFGSDIIDNVFLFYHQKSIFFFCMLLLFILMRYFSSCNAHCTHIYIYIYIYYISRYIMMMIMTQIFYEDGNEKGVSATCSKPIVIRRRSEVVGSIELISK